MSDGGIRETRSARQVTRQGWARDPSAHCSLTFYAIAHLARAHCRTRNRNADPRSSILGQVDLMRTDDTESLPLDVDANVDDRRPALSPVHRSSYHWQPAPIRPSPALTRESEVEC